MQSLKIASILIYISKKVLEKFGVNLGCPQFRGNRKWSNRVGDAFLNQGKIWNKGAESKVKYLVAECVAKNPKAALNQHKRNSIDALVESMEGLIKS